MQRTQSLPWSPTAFGVDVVRLELKSLTALDVGRLWFVEVEKMLWFDGNDALRLRLELFVDSNLTVHPLDGQTILSLIFLGEEDRIDFLLGFVGPEDGLRELNTKLIAAKSAADAVREAAKRSAAVSSAGTRGQVRASVDAESGALRGLAQRFTGFMASRLNRRGSERREDANVGVLSSKSEISVVEPTGCRESPSAVAVRRMPEVTFIGGESIIAEPSDMRLIRQELCLRARSADWRLLFRLSRDGTSLMTVAASVRGMKPVVLLVKDSAGERFGAQVSGGLGMARTLAHAGDVFVFRLSPAFTAWHIKPSVESYAFCSAQELVVGGREGGASAIWMDSSLFKGFSEACPEFGSEALTAVHDFTVSDVEIWLVDLHTFRC